MSVAFIAFGIKTLDQGFFHDDWHHVYYAHNYGLEGLKQFLFFDSRPFASIFYGPFFALLGFDRFNWHLLVLALRFLTVLVFWGCPNLIWPGHQKENGLAATLFLVYPVFHVQPNAVAYALHWFTYLVFMFSLFLMILAQRKPDFALWLSLAALLLQDFHLLMIGYFAGIELIRPLLLWQLLPSARSTHSGSSSIPSLARLSRCSRIRITSSHMPAPTIFSMLPGASRPIRSCPGLGCRPDSV